MSNKETEQVDLSVECPCGGTVMLTRGEDGEFASLLHTMPMCEQYEKLEPDEYFRWLRGKLEGQFDA